MAKLGQGKRWSGWALMPKRVWIQANVCDLLLGQEQLHSFIFIWCNSLFNKKSAGTRYAQFSGSVKKKINYIISASLQVLLYNTFVFTTYLYTSIYISYPCHIFIFLSVSIFNSFSFGVCFALSTFWATSLRLQETFAPKGCAARCSVAPLVEAPVVPVQSYWDPLRCPSVSSDHKHRHRHIHIQ